MNGIEYETEMRERLKELNRRYCVVESPEQLRGTHLADCRLHKPGVYRVMLTWRNGNGATCMNGFCRQDILRIAREQGMISAPNGFTMP